MGFALICPDCRFKFPWKKGVEWPRHCPKCGEKMGSDRADDDIVMPFISKAANRSVDQVYRAVEKSSQVRAEQAAQMAGVPVSDMKAVEVTNLRDGQRAGDIAAVPVRNEVTRFMQQPEVQNLNNRGLAFSQDVMRGRYPNVGAKMMSVLREAHPGNVDSLMPTHGDRSPYPAKGWEAVGDRPANEVLQPGYRRRG